MKKKIVLFVSVLTLASLILTSCGKLDLNIPFLSKDKNEESSSAKEDSKSDKEKDDSEKKEKKSKKKKDKAEKSKKTKYTIKISDEQRDEDVYLASYRPILDDYYETAYFLDEYEVNPSNYGIVGAEEVVRVFDNREDALDAIGYCLPDLNGDDIPELVIGDISYPEVDNILAIYTLVENEPVMVANGMARSRWRLTSDGKLFNFGSSGASYSIFSIYEMTEDEFGPELVRVEGYFSVYSDSEEKDVYYQCNEGSEGDFDTTNATLLKDDSDAFWAREIEMEDRCITPDYLSLSSFDASMFDYDIYAAFAGYNSLEQFEAYYIDNTDDYYLDVAVVGLDEVKDLEFLRLIAKDEDGEAGFTSEIADKKDVLNKDEGVILKIVFEGDLPEYAVKYTDKDGNERICAIELSGYDGSLLLTELTPSGRG